MVPNFSVALARFGQLGHHLLGLLPEAESIPDYMLKVDDIQIPETMQLVLVFPRSSAMPKSFKALVVILKDHPLPVTGRVVKYSFPHLRIPGGGFASPSNADLFATSTNSRQFTSSPYLCLGLLPNLPVPLPFGPLPPPPPFGLHQPISLAIPPPIPPLFSMPPFIPNLMIPRFPLPLAESAESTLIHSLQQYVKNKKGNELFFSPENFSLTIVSHTSFLSSANEYPIGIIPKFLPLSSRFIQLPTPKNMDDSQDLWTDFLVVADTKKDQQPSIFFQPIIFTPAEQQLTNNGVRLPLQLRMIGSSNETVLYDGVLVRNMFESLPSKDFLLYCITPNTQSNETSIDKKKKSDADVLDYPAMQPRNKPVSSTTQLPVIYTTKPTTRKPTTTYVPSTTKPSVDHEVRNNNVKPFPSKKSWKNQRKNHLTTTIEPSVNVVKRAHNEATEFSIMSFLGF